MLNLRQRLEIARAALFPDRYGIFVRYPYISSVTRHIPPYSAVEALLRENETIFEILIDRMAAHLPGVHAGINDGDIPWEECGMFPKLDAFAAYCMVREYKPNRIVEIGSGASSRILSRALRDNGAGHMTCIDPLPRRDIEDLDITFERRLLSEEDVALVEIFNPKDILFVDSSHLLFPGFDTDIEFNRLFPALPIGTIVHVHDIFLPDGYPDEWYQRFYSEQNALIGWILSGYFEVLYPSYFAATRMTEKVQTTLGTLAADTPEQNAGSIWLMKR